MSSGVYVELYCREKFPEQVVAEVSILLAENYLDCIMLVDDDLIEENLPEGAECTGILICPPAFMGKPMQTVAELQAWLTKVRAGIMPFNEPPQEEDRGEDPEFG